MSLCSTLSDSGIHRVGIRRGRQRISSACRGGGLWLCGFALVALAGCGGAGGDEEIVLRLVDRFEPQMVQGSPQSAGADPQAAWDFAKGTAEDGDALLGWRAGPGVADLRVVDGRLTGRSTTDFPVIYAERPAMEDNGSVYSLDLRIRASDGGNINATGMRTEGRDLNQFVQSTFPPPMSSPLRAGEVFQNLSLQPANTMPLRNAETIAIRPVDVAGATFEIESVRLVSQQERLESLPTGVSWSGLGEIFRETIVSRSPEQLQMEVEIPPDAWLDLYLGTLDNNPVTFKITAGSGEAERVLLERTVTTPHRWQPAEVDLAELSGPATLTFSLDVEAERQVGYWGSPAIRRRGAMPQTAHTPAEALGGIEAPQGVILIMCDTLRKDHLNAYGYERETAPFLAQMASRGALFVDNVSQATWTKVSTPSIVTSLYPSSHRVLDFHHRLSPAATTLAEVYRQAGYATASYSSVLFTGKFTNLHQGFEELHESGSANDPEYPAKTARTFVDRATKWIERHRETPFFLYLHVFDPHDPFKPRSPYDTAWADPTKKEEHEENVEAAAKVIEDPLMKQFHMPNKAELEKAGIDAHEYIGYEQDWYDGSIRGMDAEVARLVERLRSLGLEEKTQIAFISDHGEEFIEHGKMFHGHSVYGELTGVPLILYRPGVIPSVKVTETVRSIDLMPTLLDLSGLAVPEGAQGQSLVPLLAAARDTSGDSLAENASAAGWQPLPAVTEKAKTENAGGPPPRDTESYAIVLDGWKLIHNRIPAPGAPEFELYNHKEDPLNANNVAADHPDIVERLKGELESWHKMVADGQLPENLSEENLSPAELERLRSLGYIK